MAVLLEDGGGSERRLEAVHRSSPHDATERPQRLAALFLVVGERVEPMLHRRRCAQARDDAAFPGRERQSRRDGRISARERESR